MAPASKPSIAILNGTSRTGTELARLALSAGHPVHLLVRSAARVSTELTQPTKPDLLSIHELPDLFDPAALQPLLAEADFLLLCLIRPAAQLRQPTTLNQDGAHAAVAAVRANTKGDAAPRTKIMLVSAALAHPAGGSGFMLATGRWLLAHQARDLERAGAYLEQQRVWGLETARLMPGPLVRAAAPEPEEVRRQGVRLARDPHELGERQLSYGRLGGAFLQLIEGWEEWRGGFVTPVPVGEPVKGTNSDAPVLIGQALRDMLRSAAWGAALVAVGWQIGVRYGDAGLGKALNGQFGRS